MNYHHLYYFKTIAEEGTISRAATRLRLGQPTLSAQLRTFEDTLGITLFERRHKRLILTEQGKVALEYAKGIFKMGSEMIEVLHDRLRPNRPSLHIASLDSIPKQIILQLVKAAYAVTPCQVSLSEGKSDELIRELASHRVDLVITNFLPMGVDAKGLFPRPVSKRNVAFYGAPAFKSLRKNFPRSLSGLPMILPTYDSKLRYDIDSWAQGNALELDIIAETQDIAMKKHMAVDGLGLIPTATHTVTQEVRAGDLVEIGSIQGVHEELYLISAKRKIENPIAAQLMKSFAL